MQVVILTLPLLQQVHWTGILDWNTGLEDWTTELDYWIGVLNTGAFLLLRLLTVFLSAAAVRQSKISQVWSIAYVSTVNFITHG